MYVYAHEAHMNIFIALYCCVSKCAWVCVFLNGFVGWLTG